MVVALAGAFIDALLTCYWCELGCFRRFEEEFEHELDA